MPHAINNKKQRKRHRADAKAFAHQADQVALTGGDQERVQRLRKIAAMEARLGTSKSTKRKGGVIAIKARSRRRKCKGLLQEGLAVMEKVLKACIAGAALFGVLCGCAPNNPDSLRSDPGVSAIFESALPYKTVYENEQHGFLGCMTGSYDTAPGPGFPGMTFAIQPRIDPEKKSASIVLVHHGAWKDIWAVVDIASKEEGSTVRAYSTGHPLMKDFGGVAKAWASGSTQCQKFAITTQQYPLSE